MCRARRAGFVVPLLPFSEMLTVLSRPYEDQAAFADYANAPQADERAFRTFCGT
jgi:serine/tyrosine/threonine adenylyltransferase